MGYANWLKLGKPKHLPAKPTIPAKGQQVKTPSWLSEKWNRYGNAGINVATGAAAGSMIPLAAGKEVNADIERIKELGDRS
jgi:hypothetical protein